MYAVLRVPVILLLAIFVVAGRASAQTQQEAAPPPETIQAPPMEKAPQSVPGVLFLTPTPPLPSQSQPQTCPDTGQKLELIG